MEDLTLSPAIRKPTRYKSPLIKALPPRARYFDTTSNQFLQRTSFPVTSVPLTMACWFRSRTSANFQRLMQLVNPGVLIANRSWFTLQAATAASSNQLNVNTADPSTSESILTTTGYTVGKWHHACGIWLNNALRYVFIDGGSFAQGTTSVTPTSVSVLYLARFYEPLGGSNFYSDCEIAHAAVWNTNLVDRDVRDLAVNRLDPTDVRPENLVAYWPLGGPYSEVNGDKDFVGTYDLSTTSLPPLWAQGPWLRSIVRRQPVPTIAWPKISLDWYRQTVPPKRLPNEVIPY